MLSSRIFVLGSFISINSASKLLSQYFFQRDYCHSETDLVSARYLQNNTVITFEQTNSYSVTNF